MLFDLRSRGRRRTVQGIYLFLAILLGGGLILFGVGTGSGGGGLFGAFLGNGSGNSQSTAVSSQVKSAQRQAQQNPNNPASWSNLISARWEDASSRGLDSSTDTYNAAGKVQLTGITQAWQHYISLTKKPDSDTAILAARSFEHLSNYSGAAKAWQVVGSADPSDINAYGCLAENAYAAKQTRVGDLALAKAVALAPKSDQAQIKSQVAAAKSQPAYAQNC